MVCSPIEQRTYLDVKSLQVSCGSKQKKSLGEVTGRVDILQAELLQAAKHGPQVLRHLWAHPNLQQTTVMEYNLKTWHWHALVRT